MAWLSEQRQRLPPELRRPHSRPGMRGLWAALPAVHAAQLFLRVTSDVVILNSACGEPLALAGAWQWFDGPTFMSMLDELDRQQAGAPRGAPIDWPSLLREWLSNSNSGSVDWGVPLPPVGMGTVGRRTGC